MDVSKQKKLVGIIHHLEVGGAEKMMVNILNYFSLDNMEVHLIVFNFSGELKASLNSELIVHDLGIASVMKGMPKCLKTIYGINPDIVFSGIGHLNIALAPFIPIMKFLLAQSRWVSRETNIVSLQNKTSKYPKLFDWLYKHVYKNYDNIIAQSKDMKEDLEKYYVKSEKIVLINNPIDSKRVKRLSLEKTNFKFDDTKVNLLSVSRLREQKRHDLMLETMTFLPKQYHLTIVGSGEEEKKLKKICKDLDLEARVTFEGQQANPYTYMKNADLFLLSSEREGFPNVLLEANVLGLPIVAFSCKGGITEIISEGINGFYVPFSECENMAQKIEKAISFNFNKNMIIEDTIRKYSQENILKKYKEIFLK